MSTTYRTVQGDVLDRIVWKHYGHKPGALEFVLSENPSLRHEAAVLTPGQIVRLPAFAAIASAPKVRLWT